MGIDSTPAGVANFDLGGYNFACSLRQKKSLQLETVHTWPVFLDTTILAARWCWLLSNIIIRFVLCRASCMLFFYLIGSHCGEAMNHSRPLQCYLNEMKFVFATRGFFGLLFHSDCFSYSSRSGKSTIKALYQNLAGLSCISKVFECPTRLKMLYQPASIPSHQLSITSYAHLAIEIEKGVFTRDGTGVSYQYLFFYENFIYSFVCIGENMWLFLWKRNFPFSKKFPKLARVTGALSSSRKIWNFLL